MASGGTPAIVLVERAGVQHRVHAYALPERHGRDRDERPDYGLEAAAALGVEPSRVCKTLVAAIDGGRLVAAVLPEDVRETWRLYNNTAAIYDKHVTEGPRWMRDALSKAAGWRLKTGRYKFPVEQKVFDLYVRATGQTQPGAADYQPTVDA